MIAASETGKEEEEDATEPLEYLSRIRDHVGKILRPTSKEGRAVNYDIEQNIREIRAILATNAEIFDRCVGSMEENSHNNGYTTFMRYGFEVVKTRQIEKTTQNFGIDESGTLSYDVTTQTTQLITHPNCKKASFSTVSLSKLPSRLKIFTPKFMIDCGSVFIDYNALFKQSLLLHEDVLEPFLAELKDHLMSVQVCLGQVDKWLMDPHSIIVFLNSTFESELQIPGESEVGGTNCVCTEEVHAVDNDVCVKCESVFSDHIRIREFHMSGFERRCKRNSRDVFQCRKTIVLKECATFGKCQFSFNVSSTIGQTRLTKFVEFIST